MKKIFCVLLAALLLALPVYAADESISISVGTEFTEYRPGENGAATAELLHMSETALASYCEENHIIYLAVNGDNSRQIRVSVAETAFSVNVGDLSALDDEKINALLPELSGRADIRGKIEESGGQKFVKTEVSTSDSGGDYTVTQLMTVFGKKEYTLSFYTTGDSTAYTEKIFESFAENFQKNAPEKKNYRFVILAAIVLLCVGAGYIVFTLVRDIKNERAAEQDSPDGPESE